MHTKPQTNLSWKRRAHFGFLCCFSHSLNNQQTRSKDSLVPNALTFDSDTSTLGQVNRELIQMIVLQFMIWVEEHLIYLSWRFRGVFESNQQMKTLFLAGDNALVPSVRIQKRCECRTNESIFDVLSSYFIAGLDISNDKRLFRSERSSRESQS